MQYIDAEFAVGQEVGMPQFITDDGVKLFYEEYGQKNGKPVVLIHGLACTHEYFKEQIPVLAKEHRVIAYDLRGNGKSEKTFKHLTIPQCAKDLNGLIRFLGLEKTSLIAWSYGVNVVFSYAEQFGCDAIDRIVLADNTPKMLCDADWKYGVFPDYQSMVAGFSFMASDWNTYVSGAVPSFFGEGAEPEREEFDWVMSRFSDNDPGIILTMFVNNSTFDARGGLPRINVPVLLTHGTLPSYCTKDIMEGIAGLMENSRVEEFYGGHLHMIQDAAHFNNVVLDFLGQSDQ